MDAFVPDQQQAFREVREALEERQAAKDRSRQSHNDGIGRVSPGRQVEIGDNVLVKEAASTLPREGIHSKFAHEHWTGPWQLVRIIHPGLSYAVHLNGRSIWKRIMSAADIKPLMSARWSFVMRLKTSSRTWPEDRTLDLPRVPRRQHRYIR